MSDEPIKSPFYDPPQQPPENKIDGFLRENNVPIVGPAEMDQIAEYLKATKLIVVALNHNCEFGHPNCPGHNASFMGRNLNPDQMIILLKSILQVLINKPPDIPTN